MIILDVLRLSCFKPVLMQFASLYVMRFLPSLVANYINLPKLPPYREEVWAPQ
jgi:hypothetical protein